MRSKPLPCEPVQPTRLTLNGRVLDRRAFLGALSLTAAGSLLVGRGWSAASAAPNSLGMSQQPTGMRGDWHVDDMWGHMPRYAHPIPYTATYSTLDLANVDPVDHAFVS